MALSCPMLSCEIARLPTYSSGNFDGNYQRGGGNNGFNRYSDPKFKTAREAV